MIIYKDWKNKDVIKKNTHARCVNMKYSRKVRKHEALLNAVSFHDCLVCFNTKTEQSSASCLRTLRECFMLKRSSIKKAMMKRMRQMSAL